MASVELIELSNKELVGPALHHWSSHACKTCKCFTCTVWSFVSLSLSWFCVFQAYRVGQPWVTNLRIMWTGGWVMSKSTQDSQNVGTKLLSLPDNAKKFTSAKIKILTLSKGPPVWPHHQHTHKTSKNFTYVFVLGPLQFQSTGQSTHLTSKTVILLCWLSRKIQHTSTQTKSPVSESSTHPLQNYICFFLLTSRTGSYAHKPTRCHCP